MGMSPRAVPASVDRPTQSGPADAPLSPPLSPGRLALGWDSDQLIFAQFDVSRLRLPSDADAVDLHTARPQRAAQFDDLSAHPRRVANLDAISQLQELSRLLLGHRQVLLC